MGINFEKAVSDINTYMKKTKHQKNILQRNLKKSDKPVIFRQLDIFIFVPSCQKA
jgi:hypothetical protein